MQGGITSGIVYPAAVKKLHSRYDFRSIGGASAGAIGAALTAAAQYGEYGRRHGEAPTGGFDRLTEAAQQVAAPGVLLGLFQPTRPAAWAFGLLFGLQSAGSSWPRRVWVVARWAVRYFAAPVLLAAGVSFGALVGVLYGFGGGLDEPRWFGWVLIALVLVVAALLGLLAAVLVRALVTVRGLPDSYFGACSGMPRPRARTEALTPWLHRQIQRCAGREHAEPLTFADLAGLAGDGNEISLEVMTTDLSAARPLSLPFGDGQFLYSPAEFARLFPDDIRAYLERVSTPVPRPDGAAGPDDLRTFPGPGLPVVVATRMSLSFPALICAIPLWTPGAGGTAPVRHWFSDGGIASNFPMHFFDTWLPSRPTFGLDLVPAPRATGRSEAVRGASAAAAQATNPRSRRRTRTEDVDRQGPCRIGEADLGGREAEVGAGASCPDAANNQIREPPRNGVKTRRVAEITSFVGFLAQILDTMQNWRDTLLAELPGFEDRIRSVHLPEGTGGMHLTMAPPEIVKLAASGAEAGQDLLTTFNWENHQFARFTLLMRQLQENLVGAGASDSSTVAGAFTREFQEILANLGAITVPGDASTTYDARWGVTARDRTRALLAMAAEWAGPLSFVQGVDPDPPPVMRLRPRV
jgi:predicted acylesterase/phospholipase RssA